MSKYTWTGKLPTLTEKYEKIAQVKNNNKTARLL